MWDVPTDDYLPVADGGPTTDELVREMLSQVHPLALNI